MLLHDRLGTGAVALAGLLSAARLQGHRLADERFLVFGAGAGGVGVARAIRGGLMREGLSAGEACARIFVLDSKGLLVAGRCHSATHEAWIAVEILANGSITVASGVDAGGVGLQAEVCLCRIHELRVFVNQVVGQRNPRPGLGLDLVPAPAPAASRAQSNLR